MTTEMHARRQSVKVFGTTGSAEAFAIRDFLYRCDIPFEFIDVDSGGTGVEGRGHHRLPLCVFPDGTQLERTTIRQITEKLGWFRDPSRTEYDLAIYGAGPAGLS